MMQGVLPPLTSGTLLTSWVFDPLGVALAVALADVDMGPAVIGVRLRAPTRLVALAARAHRMDRGLTGPVGGESISVVAVGIDLGQRVRARWLRPSPSY